MVTYQLDQHELLSPHITVQSLRAEVIQGNVGN